MTITRFDAPNVSVSGLPHVMDNPVSTPFFELGQAVARTAFAVKGIATYDGPSGLGKTTAAVSAAKRLPVPFMYVKLHHNAGTKQVLEAIFEALHPGSSATLRVRPRETDYLDAVVDILATGNFGLICDEVHYAGVAGLIMLSQLWESVRCDTGRGFPMLLVGSSVNAAAKQAPELDTRIKARANFGPLQGDDLMAYLSQLDDRCAQTPLQLLTKVDKTFVKGNLRRWETFLEQINLNPATTGTAVAPNEIRAFLAMQHTGGTA